MASSRLAQSIDLRMLSFNLRFDSQPDKISVDETLNNLPDPLSQRSVFYKNPNERRWSVRRIGVANEVVFNKVDIAGAYPVDVTER